MNERKMEKDFPQPFTVIVCKLFPSVSCLIIIFKNKHSVIYEVLSQLLFLVVIR